MLRKMGAQMLLSAEEIDDVPNVDAAKLDEVLGSDAFGKFAILNKSDGEFIQAACDWRPDEETKAFLATTGSDPWVLEYRENGRQHGVEGHVTLEQVLQAFQSYLAGGSEWRTAFAWRALKA
jgi:hypothetical protein